jgi:hypothetical protein
VKCWTSAGHWKERERERDVVGVSMCVCTLPYVERDNMSSVTMMDLIYTVTK